MTGKEQHGNRYWCVGLEMGPRCTPTPTRFEWSRPARCSSCVAGGDDSPEQVNLAFANGQWRYVYAASVLDGHSVAAVHWPGQIVEGSPEDWAT